MNGTAAERGWSTTTGETQSLPLPATIGQWAFLPSLLSLLKSASTVYRMPAIRSSACRQLNPGCVVFFFFFFFYRSESSMFVNIPIFVRNISAACFFYHFRVTTAGRISWKEFFRDFRVRKLISRVNVRNIFIRNMKNSYCSPYHCSLPPYWVFILKNLECP